MESILKLLNNRKKKLDKLIAKAEEFSTDISGLYDEYRQVDVAISLITNDVNYVDWNFDLGDTPFSLLPEREPIYKKL